MHGETHIKGLSLLYAVDYPLTDHRNIGFTRNGFINIFFRP